MPRLSLNSYGLRLEVEVEDERLQRAVEQILPPGWRPSQEFPEDGRFTLAGRVTGAYTVLVDGAPIGTRLTADVALHLLDAQLRIRVAGSATDRIFVHAGVVALGARALLLPGSSFCGKSTLVAALVAQGAMYYSDEYAVLDEDGAVYPYPRHLSMRADWKSPGDYISVEALGGRAGTGPARPALVAVTVYTPGERWRPQPRKRQFGALSLLANTVPATTRPQASLVAVSRAVAHAEVVEGQRGEAAETATLLLATLRQAGASSGD